MKEDSYKYLASFRAPCGWLWFNHLKVCHWENKGLRHAWVEINGQEFKNKLHGNIVLHWCNQTQQPSTKSYLYDSYLRAVKTVTVPGSHWFYSGWLPCCCLCSRCIGLNLMKNNNKALMKWAQCHLPFSIHGLISCMLLKLLWWTHMLVKMRTKWKTTLGLKVVSSLTKHCPI